MDNLHVLNKNISLWNSSFKDIDNAKNLSQDKILDILEDHYQFVEKNSEDKLNFELKSTVDKI